MAAPQPPAQGTLLDGQQLSAGQQGALHAHLVAEIERITRVITHLEGEREALRRVLLRVGGAQRSGRGRIQAHTALGQAVLECVTQAGSVGIKMPDVIAVVQPNTEWKTGSIRTALYNLRAQGYVVLEGHWWKPAPEMTSDAARG